MAVESIRYSPTLGTAPADSARGPSNAIWGSCPWATLQQEPRLGYTFFDDFTMAGNAAMSAATAGQLGAWSVYGSAGAQVNDGLLEGGVLRLSSDATDEGLTLLSSAGSYRFVTTSTLALNQRMWFEARVAKSSVATARLSAFVGLMAPTLAVGLPAAAQPLTTTDDTLMTAGDSFGFLLTGTTGTRGGPTEVGVAFCLASGTVNHPTNLTTLMASTGNTVLAANSFVKLGWIFDPGAYTKQVTSATARQTAGWIRRPLVRFFVNGNETAAFLAAEDVANATAAQAFPTSFMAPVISMMNMASASSDYLSVDWLRIAQLSNS